MRQLPSPSAAEGYAERFGVDLRAGLVLAGSAALTGICLWLPAEPTGMWVVKVLGVALFGVGGLWFLFMVVRGGVAFRADREGVTLGHPRIPQPGMRRHPLQVPWRDVAEVVLFQQHTGLASVPYVGLHLRPGVTAPDATTFDRRSRLWRLNRRLFPGVPDEVLLRSRPVSGWRLDERRLLEAIGAFAPHVRVLRLEQDGSLRPLAPAE